MRSVVRGKLTRVGNSRGVRIPKALIEQVGLESDVEIVVQDDHLEIHRGHKPRSGWEEQFRAMAERGEDKLIDPEIPTTWDESEWEW